MDPLISAIKQRDRAALNLFFARHRDRMRDWVRFRLGVPPGRGADPSDAVQDVSIKLWQTVGAFQGTTEAQLLSWLQRQLRWWVIDLSRRRFARHASPDEGSAATEDFFERIPAEAGSPSQLAATTERETLIRESCSALSNEQMLVLTLHDVDGVRLKEIAGEFSASPVEIARLYIAATSALRETGVNLHEVITAQEAAPHSQLAGALGRLPPAERHAVLLKHLENYSMDEAALVLETTPAAIGSAVYRGMRQLKALLGNVPEAGGDDA